MEPFISLASRIPEHSPYLFLLSRGSAETDTLLLLSHQLAVQQTFTAVPVGTATISTRRLLYHRMIQYVLYHLYKHDIILRVVNTSMMLYHMMLIIYNDGISRSHHLRAAASAGD